MNVFSLKDEQPNLSAVELNVNQFEVPKQFLADFSKARHNFVYEKGHKTDKISKATLITISKDEADKLASVGLDVKEYMKLPVEIEDYKSIDALMDSEEMLAVELVNVRVKFKVDNFRAVGYKLVARSLKVIEDTKAPVNPAK
ncbi:hypothetical protein N41_1008 [Lactococcus cremoris]|uniref:hypothetical protein n=1 Tax=Lactococcus lactis subsp. cremoris TaxID=1359 RepID=UPI0007AE7EE5|nr:hypothetical protein [Lactococcus cremoris]KZK39640.1 hypothetical protein N41_1008 [Lactococcus cremoris]